MCGRGKSVWSDPRASPAGFKPAWLPCGLFRVVIPAPVAAVCVVRHGVQLRVTARNGGRYRSAELHTARLRCNDVTPSHAYAMKQAESDVPYARGGVTRYMRYIVTSLIYIHNIIYQI